ncbi:MAG: ferritin-like domain-containing protein [Candidatus Binatia bacterium]
MAYLSTTDFFEDQAFLDRWKGMMKGDLDLSWMDAATEKVRCTPQNPRRGLTFRDCDVGSYGFSELPELIRRNRSFAPRGAEIPWGLPDLQPEVSRKSEVWAYNTEGYYEEAMTRQWNASVDIPWGELAKAEVPEDQNKAFSQLCTFLTEVEMIATDVPAKWAGRLNADFLEVKNFIATQAMDEARHAEVFRKRALATGVGLMKASPINEMSLKHLRDADSFSEMSVALHLVAEGFVLTLFRFSEYISPTEIDKKMFRLVMQDEARHVGYGMQHLKYVVDHFPEKREMIHAHLNEAENSAFGGGYATELTESFIILAGKGMKRENIQKGCQITALFQAKQIEEYFERLDKCGLTERRQMSKLHNAYELTKAVLAEQGISL